MYKTKFKGSFKFINETPSEFKLKIRNFINNNFDNLINFELNTNTLYINGVIDNTNEVIENFIYKIHKFIDTKEEIIIKAQGEDIKDRWDIIINDNGMYIQNYKVVKNELIKYKS